MKVCRKDIEKILKDYESEKSVFSKIFNSDDPSIIKELTQLFQKLPQAPDYPLNETELFQLCKILFLQVPDLEKTAKAIGQLRAHLGESFNCLEALNQNGLYNGHYFAMVLNWDGNLSKLKQCLGKKFFCETMDLLTRAKMMTKPILDWLMTLSYELEELHYVLTALDKHKVLNETFLPIFVSQNAAKGYDYTVVYKRLVFSNGRLIAAVESKTFSELVQKLDSESRDNNNNAIQKKFDEFKQAVSIYIGSGIKLSYEGDDKASADDLREFFTTLFMNGILTIQRFNSLLRTPEVIPFIDEFLRIDTGSFAKPEEKLEDKLAVLNKHFDAFLDFIRGTLRTLDRCYKNIWRSHFTYINFLNNLMGKDEIITKANIITYLHQEDKFSYFSLVPLDVLKFVAASSNLYNRHEKPDALKIAMTHMNLPEPPTEAEPVQETSTSTSGKEDDHRPVLPVVFVPRPQ